MLEGIYHEYAHTCEFFCEIDGDEGNLHNVIHEYYFEQGVDYIKTIQLFLLRKTEFNGKPAGIPIAYFKHELKLGVGYMVEHGILGGGTLELKYAQGAAEEEISVIDSVLITVRMAFGTEISVEAIPKPGYRFVRWTDGVTTALRRDKVIVGVDADAIFEKIENN